MQQQNKPILTGFDTIEISLVYQIFIKQFLLTKIWSTTILIGQKILDQNLLGLKYAKK